MKSFTVGFDDGILRTRCKVSDFMLLRRSEQMQRDSYCLISMSICSQTIPLLLVTTLNQWLLNNFDRRLSWAPDFPLRAADTHS